MCFITDHNAIQIGTENSPPTWPPGIAVPSRSDVHRYFPSILILQSLLPIYETWTENWPSAMGLASRICCSIQECWPLTSCHLLSSHTPSILHYLQYLKATDEQIVNTYLPWWDWPPESAVLSRSAGHWWLPRTVESTWCSLSYQLQTLHYTVK